MTPIPGHIQARLILVATISVISAVVLSRSVFAEPTADAVTTAEPLGIGPYAVASTNLMIAPTYNDIGDDAMGSYLLGEPDAEGNPRFVTDLLEHPEATWITDVDVPDEPSLYGPASGQTLPVVSYIVYPTAAPETPREYTFPYFDGQYGRFHHMLAPGEAPAFADPDAKYPLIVFAHGLPSHGVYEVRHVQKLASHGYIVAVLTYGDRRTSIEGELNRHVGYLRPLMTKAVLDSILESDTFGPRIDRENIGVSGHSFGGFTGLAVTGGDIEGNPASVHDERFAASVIAAPWVGGPMDSGDFFAFGDDNVSLSAIDTPTICLYGTADDVTRASYILPAMEKLSGPLYVVELIDQPHVFDPPSWDDRDHWELLFFAAYLKDDPDALRLLSEAQSMNGGNEDVQHFEYQNN